LHGLRHTYASLALAKGVNAAIVSRRPGHATVAFTLDFYSHTLPQVDAEAAEVIAAFGGVGAANQTSAPHRGSPVVSPLARDFPAGGEAPLPSAYG
jgi:hypothetical protein